MKSISRFLILLLLLQSCTVYNAPTSVEAAVAANNKARVITTDNQKYHFNTLENKNNRLTGITKSGSSTSKKLAGMPAFIDGKYLEIDLSSLDIAEINLRNESKSTILTVVAIAGAVFLAVITIASIAVASSPWTLGTL